MFHGMIFAEILISIIRLSNILLHVPHTIRKIIKSKNLKVRFGIKLTFKAFIQIRCISKRCYVLNAGLTEN